MRHQIFVTVTENACRSNDTQALFNFPRILCKSDFKDASMLIWTDFKSFVITYPT